MFKLPKRKYIVQYYDPWCAAWVKGKNLGPYFRRATAEDTMKRVKWFSPRGTSWRVHNIYE